MHLLQPPLPLSSSDHHHSHCSAMHTMHWPLCLNTNCNGWLYINCINVVAAQRMMQLYSFFCAATLQGDGIQALRCKNEHNPNAHSTGGGYRDMKFNLLYQSKKIQGKTGRTIIEVQIILQSFLEVKKKMHAVYRIDRGDFG